MSQQQVRPVDRSAPGTLVARFRPLRPALWLTGGLVWSVGSGVGFFLMATGDDGSGGAAIAIPVIMVPLVAFVLFRIAFRRFARAARSGGVALAIDRNGVHVGAEPGGQPCFVPWSHLSRVRYWTTTNEDDKSSYGIEVWACPALPGAEPACAARLRMLDWRAQAPAVRGAVAAFRQDVPVTG